MHNNPKIKAVRPADPNPFPARTRYEGDLSRRLIPPFRLHQQDWAFLSWGITEYLHTLVHIPTYIHTYLHIYVQQIKQGYFTNYVMWHAWLDLQRHTKKKRSNSWLGCTKEQNSCCCRWPIAASGIKKIEPHFPRLFNAAGIKKLLYGYITSF